jgi:hypothetical protein
MNDEPDSPHEVEASSSKHWFLVDREQPLHPTPAGSIAILLFMVAGVLFMDGVNSAALARSAGLFLLAGLAFATLLDLRGDLKNLIRIDLLALYALFYLTFAEFILADQPAFSETVLSFDARQGIIAVYLGFAGLVIGRHLIRPGISKPFDHELGFPRKPLVVLLLGCFLLGNLYAFIAVHGNPLEWLYHTCGARFSQPWSRGRYGSWGTLLGEFKIVLQVVPPVAGIIFAYRRRFSLPTLVLTGLVLFLTLFQGFAEGTRNVLALNLAGFLGGFFIVQTSLKLRPIIIWTALIGLVFIYFSHHQLQFRGIGLRAYYTSGLWKKEMTPDVFKIFAAEEAYNEETNEFEGFFVDLNLRNIAGLTRVFPATYPYIGWNMPMVALTKPVPRALWPGKPEDFEIGIEEALSADAGYTLSCTFVGEAYMMAGRFGVVITGLVFGATFMLWNRVGSVPSVFQRLIFATLFYPALITMRSATAFSTALLAAFFLFVVGPFLQKHFGTDEEEDAVEEAYEDV